MVTFLFVGEKPSDRARRLQASWRNGKLSARTLHRALRAAGYDPHAHHFTNIFLCGRGDMVVSRWCLWRLRKAQEKGWVLVGLGQKVHRVLRRYKIWPFLDMIHPAARGRIRLAENYDSHVRRKLEEADPKTPW